MIKWVAVAGTLLVLFLAMFIYRDFAERTSLAGKDDAPADPAASGDSIPRTGEPRGEPPSRSGAHLESDPGSAQAEGEGESAAEPTPPSMPASGHFEAMQRTFEAQARDSRWAREQEARIPQLLAEAGFPDDAFDRNLTCRRTLCRFTLRVGEADMFALMKFAAAVQTREGLGLAYGDAEVAGDKSRIVVYTPREGTSREDLRPR